ncbi:hypothetical protein HIM_06086 [Hirsutella minnesotensis 3608]|uniref:Uncharacterized protein n=1 Tax=Hirsutella minnesotensis 3608 TaxID=1043627 RepID=A0A0F7ZNX1_9HYPO|nr:hypothetical protein HIM_06086 [Hirsutella minnesotensis 3608]
MSQMSPNNPEIGVFKDYIARQPETLIVKEKVFSLSGDSFDIKLANGQPMFKVSGHAMSISSRMSMHDMSGNHMLDIRKEHFHFHPTYVAQDPKGNAFLTVRNAIKLFGSKATAEFQSGHGRNETLAMKGSWFDWSADIVCKNTGAVVATIDRKYKPREFLAAKQTYALKVMPGVDMALMCALCIAFDEANNDKGNRGGTKGFFDWWFTLPMFKATPRHAKTPACNRPQNEVRLHDRSAH